MESINSPIRDIIAKGKNSNTDFLLHVKNTNEVAQMLVSFANTNGGQIIVGVNNSQKIKGISPVDEKLLLDECIKERCIPAINFNSSTHQVGRHLLLVVEILKSEIQSKVKNDNGVLIPFYRIEGNVVPENKILKQVSIMVKHKASLTIDLLDNAVDLLNQINSSSPISLSQLYKKSNLPLKEVDENVVLLIYNRKIHLIFRDNQILYTT